MSGTNGNEKGHPHRYDGKIIASMVLKIKEALI